MHQNAGGHGVGYEQMSPLPPRGSGVVTPGIFCIFLIQNPLKIYKKNPVVATIFRVILIN